MKTKLTELANKIVMVRKHQGGIISTPTVPFFPDDHLLGEYVEPTRPLPLTYKSGQHTGAMIALFLPATYARKYALSDSGALDPSEMHVTLAGLGKADELSGPAVNSIHEFMELVSEHHPPLTGTINGCGRFCNGDDDGDPFFIIPDLPDLPNLRELIVLWLRGNDIPVGQDHGFTPHITLTYLPHAEYNPFDILERAPVSFPAISLVLAGDRYDYPLNGGMETKADLVEKINERGKYKLEVEATKTVFERFKRFLAMLSHNTSVGHSANFGMFADGDGADYLKINGLDLSKYIKELKDFQAKYNSIEMAGEDGYYSLPLESRSNPTKAALVTKIGARHTGAECAVIQKMHDLALELGAECHPMTRRAGARHSHADQGMVQRIHDDCAGLGATCKALPAKDDLYHSQVLKERRADLETLKRVRKSCGLSETGDTIKAQSDAPNYEPASTPQRCKNCRFFLGDPGRDYCELFDFTADQDYICDAWEAGRPDEIPGYVANKADLARLTEGILILRGGRTSGNWGHVGRKGKRGGSGGGGGFGRIGVKPGASRKTVKRAAKKKQAKAKPKPQAKPKAAAKKPTVKPKAKAKPVAAKKPAEKPKPEPAAKKPAAKKRVAKEDKVPKTDKTASGDVKDAKATNNKQMTAASENWQKNMTAAELDGLQTYQSSEFGNINGSLRGQEKATADNKKAIRNIDKSLAKSALKEDTVVFRNMDQKTLEGLLGPDMKKWTGQGYSDKGYTSTSIDPGGTGGFRGIPMEIRVPKGTPSGYLANLPGGGKIASTEQELLLGRGQKFRILKVKGGRRPKIIAEIVK